MKIEVGTQVFDYMNRRLSEYASMLYDVEGNLKIAPNNAAEIVLDCLSAADLDWLTSVGYFECPAAVSHHGNYKGGLFIHSLVVGMELQNLTYKLDLVWQNEKSPMRVGLLHDICKVDDYKWDGDTIEYNKNKKFEGHGDKSILLLKGNIEITEEEEMCIRYHMGAFTEKTEWNEYSKACAANPNVLFTHTADMMASQCRGL